MQATTTQPTAFHLMTKPRGAICNLDCKYCYFLSKEALYPGSKFRMSDNLLEEYIRQYIEAQQVNDINFAWQGGEPTLMGLDFFRQAVRYQQKHRRPGMRITNALQTNAVTLDDEWCEFFAANDFLLGVSLDGPADVHDYYRVDKGGNPTFHKVIAGIRLLQKHKAEYNILTTVHAANEGQGQRVYKFLRDEVGTVFMQFIPIVERDNDTGYQEGEQVTDRSITAVGYGQFLIDMYEEWVRRDVGKVFVQNLRYRPGRLDWRAARSLHFRRDLRSGAGDGAQWRCLLLRSLCRAGLQTGKYPRCAAERDRGHGRAGRFRASQARYPAAVLPGLRSQVRLQWRLPQEPLHRDAGWRTWLELSMRRLSRFLQSHPPDDEFHGC